MYPTLELHIATLYQEIPQYSWSDCSIPLLLFHARSRPEAAFEAGTTYCWWLRSDRNPVKSVSFSTVTCPDEFTWMLHRLKLKASNWVREKQSHEGPFDTTNCPVPVTLKVTIALKSCVYAAGQILSVLSLYSCPHGMGFAGEHVSFFMVTRWVYLEQGFQTHFHQRPYQARCCLQSSKCNFRTL